MAITNAAGTVRPRMDMLPEYNEFDPSQVGFIRTQLFPRAPVPEYEGVVPVVPREVFLQHIVTKRRPGSPPKRANMDLTNGAFELVEYNFEMALDLQAEKRYKSWHQLDRLAATSARHKIELDLENDAAAVAFSTTVFPNSGSTGFTPSTKWDASSSTPLDEINDGHEAFELLHGVAANTVVMSRGLKRVLSRNEQIYSEAIPFGLPGNGLRPAEIPTNILADILGVENIIEVGPGVVKSSANPGQTATPTRLWSSDYMLLCRVATGPNDPLPSLGYSLQHDDEAEGVELYEFDTTSPRGRVFAAAHTGGIWTPDNPAGFLFSDVLT